MSENDFCIACNDSECINNKDGYCDAEGGITVCEGICMTQEKKQLEEKRD